MIQPYTKRFVIGVDRAKMRLYDCEQKHKMIFLTVDKKRSIMISNRNLKNHSQNLNFND